MDLESESSVLESVEDNGLIVPSVNNLIDTNVDCSFENVAKSLSDKMKPEGGQSLPVGSIGSTSQVKKGNGLKKWKRIPREESSKERENSVDNDKVGKRGFSNATNDSRNRVVSAETRQRSEGSVSSTNAVVRSQGLGVGGFDSVLGIGPATESENSEDRSSKSSTAASAPRWRSGGYIGDNNGIISSYRDHNLAAQRGQQGKSRTGSGKKPRGNQVKIEAENSHSSMESDSRSSNFVFMQGSSSVISKGRQSRRSANYDGENSDDEAQGSEQHFAEELQAGFRKNMAESEDVSQSYLPADLNWKTKGVNNENIGLSADQDPLLECITTLQSAQEALAQELQKFREIGEDDSDVVQDNNRNLFEQQQYGETRQTRPSSLESEKWNVNKLESKLADTRFMLEVKESKVIELEASLNSNAPRQEENRKNIELEQKNSRDLKSLESLYKQKIKAEVELLDESTLLEEQKTVATEQAKIVNLSENIGTRASMLKRQVDKLEIEVETGEYVKLGKKICKFASLFLLQLVLLFVVLCFFVLQLVPEYTEDVPT